MIDERQEELASLYALDLLEGAELAQFETALARDRELQRLVRELREASSSLAHLSPTAQPPAALRDRVLASIEARAPSISDADDGKVIRPTQFSLFAYVPWAVAACLALLGALAFQRYAGASREASALRDQVAAAELARRGAQQQLEAERILARQQVASLDRTVLEIREQLAATKTQLAASEIQLTDRERQIMALGQRIDALAGASAQIGSELGQAKETIARLTQEMKIQGDIADLKISFLASQLKDSPQAQAVAVWDPKTQQGMLSVANLPPVPEGKQPQLWIVDPQYPIPVDGGVFDVDPKAGTTQVRFKANVPVKAVAAFAITIERKGGVPKAENEMVLVGK